MAVVLILELPSEWNEETSRHFLGGLRYFAGLFLLPILSAAAATILSKPFQRRKVQELEQKLQNYQLAKKAENGTADMETLRERALNQMSANKKSAWIRVKITLFLTVAAIIFASMFGGKDAFLTALVLSAAAWVTVGISQFSSLSYQQENVTARGFQTTVIHQRFRYMESVTKSCRLVVREHYYITILLDGKELEIPCSKETYVQVLNDKNVFLVRLQQGKRQYFQVYSQNADAVYAPGA